MTLTEYQAMLERFYRGDLRELPETPIAGACVPVGASDEQAKPDTMCPICDERFSPQAAGSLYCAGTGSLAGTDVARCLPGTTGTNTPTAWQRWQGTTRKKNKK